MRVLSTFWILCLSCLSAASQSSSDLTGEALRSFPARLNSVEFEDVSKTIYSVRPHSSGRRQVEVFAALAQIGIDQRQISNIAVASDAASSSYGLLTGSFSGDTVVARNRHRPFVIHLRTHPVFCTATAWCILFLNNSIAAFGALSGLDRMLDVRAGAVPQLADDRLLNSLLNYTRENAPIRGVLVGDQTIYSALSAQFPQWTEWRRIWPRVSGQIEAIGYSVDSGRPAGIEAAVLCTSGTAAGLLRGLLSTANNISLLSLSPHPSYSGLPLKLSRVSASGATIYLRGEMAYH